MTSFLQRLKCVTSIFQSTEIPYSAYLSQILWYKRYSSFCCHCPLRSNITWIIDFKTKFWRCNADPVIKHTRITVQIIKWGVVPLSCRDVWCAAEGPRKGVECNCGKMLWWRDGSKGLGSERSVMYKEMRSNRANKNWMISIFQIVVTTMYVFITSKLSLRYSGITQGIESISFDAYLYFIHLIWSDELTIWSDKWSHLRNSWSHLRNWWSDLWTDDLIWFDDTHIFCARAMQCSHWADFQWISFLLRWLDTVNDEYG